MYDKVQVFTGENPDVKKFVFEKEDICVEAVLYKYGSYEKRTVLCISTQCGCPVGCSFCGTGKNFVRNLTTMEITDQVAYVIEQVEEELWPMLPDFGYRAGSLNGSCEKFQIMFMSMGEPMLNWPSVKESIQHLNRAYPNAQLLISTMGINDPEVFKDICLTSKFIPMVGLQFSVHAMYDEERDRIIPFKNKMDLRQLRNSGLLWSQATGRQVFLNYCFGSTVMFNLDRVFDMFDPMSFALTFSVVCENEVGKVRTQEIKDMVTATLYTIQNKCLSEGYNVRLFDPAGQELGAGCGQLFYVQEWMRARKN